jgi:N-hydroxyarylamine O-acetyltransferase
MQLTAYLRRLNYSGTVEPALKNLRALHRAHVLHIPFENLDIHYPQRILLEPDRFFDKIVRRQRGGFCYEQNGLLYEILQLLGYQASLISASVYQPDLEGFGPPAAHVAILVELENRQWLVDVGFGSSFPEPLLLEKDQTQEQDGVLYVMSSTKDETWILDRSFDGGNSYTPMYEFDLIPRKLSAFQEMCDFHQSSEASPLFRKKLVSIARPGGRITLTSSHLIITQNSRRQEMEIRDEADFREKLRQYFGFSIVAGKVENLDQKTNQYP